MSDSAGAPKLFISYRRDETPVSAAWLYEVLVERFGESNVFMDLTLKPGEDFVERITDVLGSCHILLLVMGPRWAHPDDGDGRASIRDPDDFVRLEAEVAMARSDVEVLPVLVGGAKMPHRDELPEKIQGLTRIQAKSLTNERRAEDMHELVVRVDELLPPETTVNRAPEPPPPTPPVTDPQGEGRRVWPIAIAAAAALVAAVAVVVATGALSGGGSGDSEASTGVPYRVDQEVGDLDARGDLIALTKKVGDSLSMLGRLDLTSGKVVDLASEPADYNGLDVGTDPQGHEALVASRCGQGACDVNRLRAGDEPVALGLSTDTCQAVRPSMDAGRVLFSLAGGACETRGLYVTNASATDPQQIFPGPTKGADLDGSIAAALLNSRTLGLWDMNDEAEGLSTQIEAGGGHELVPPVVVADHHVYFLDRAGSSYWIARIDLAADTPVLERYVPPDSSGAAPSAPRFGVTSGRLYVTGLPRPDGTAGNRVIVRDDDPGFERVDGAVREL